MLKIAFFPKFYFHFNMSPIMAGTPCKYKALEPQLGIHTAH
jgi:hypothetical protein